jgi:hypothetical protein
MTEHTHKVIRQDKLNRLAKWRKGIKYTLGEKKSNAPGSVVVHRTVYKDDSEKIEYLRSKKKDEFIPSPYTDDELIDEMEKENHEGHRILFGRSGKI